jgi:hypothetical protein
VSALVTFLLGAVMPDAYTRAIDRDLSDTEEKRLLRLVQDQTPGFVVDGNVFGAWLHRDENWDLLLASGPQGRKSLEDSWVEETYRRDSRLSPESRDIIRQRAQQVVTATLASFIESLESSRAVAASAALLLAEIAQTRSSLQGGIHQVQKDVGHIRDDLDPRHDLLPEDIIVYLKRLIERVSADPWHEDEAADRCVSAADLERRLYIQRNRNQAGQAGPVEDADALADHCRKDRVG